MNLRYVLFVVLLLILLVSVSLIVSPEEGSPKKVMETYSSDNLVYAVQIFNCNNLVLESIGYREDGFVVINKDIVLSNYDRIRVIDEKGISHPAEVYEVHEENVLLRLIISFS